jgi:hypothetical protein
VTRKPRRPIPGTLPALLLGILAERSLTLDEAAKAVRAAGYPIRAKSFRRQVADALRNRERFRKVDGKYTATRSALALLAQKPRARTTPASPLRPGTLPARLSELLTGRTMKIGEAASALQAGQKRRVAYTQVADALRDPRRFRRVGWGQYRAIPQPPRPPKPQRQPARPKAETLSVMLRAVLQGKVMAGGEATKAVVAAGYKTRSKHLITAVCHHLADGKRFRVVATRPRRRYTAR